MSGTVAVPLAMNVAVSVVCTGAALASVVHTRSSLTMPMSLRGWGVTATNARWLGASRFG
jgi:hypothetical protein